MRQRIGCTLGAAGVNGLLLYCSLVRFLKLGGPLLVQLAMTLCIAQIAAEEGRKSDGALVRSPAQKRPASAFLGPTEPRTQSSEFPSLALFEDTVPGASPSQARHTKQKSGRRRATSLATDKASYMPRRLVFRGCSFAQPDQMPGHMRIRWLLVKVLNKKRQRMTR